MTRRFILCEDGRHAHEDDTVAVTGVDGAGVAFEAYPFVVATVSDDAFKGWPDGPDADQLCGKHWFMFSKCKVNLIDASPSI